MTDIQELQFSTLDVSVQQRVAWVALSRPQRLNAISATMMDEMVQALACIEYDEQIRVVVLRGAGRCFSSGFDVSRDLDGGYAVHEDVVSDFGDLDKRMRQLMAVWDHPKPVLAAVHGYCLAAASVLASMCDMTIVASDAQIGLPPLPLGGGFLSPAWVHLVGPKRAKELSFDAGRRIDGETASQWGWANYAVPEDQLFEEIAKVAASIARTPSDVLKMKKLAINRVVELSGFKTAALMGALNDALLHQSNGVKQARRLIKEHGLKEALQGFANGSLEL